MARRESCEARARLTRQAFTSQPCAADKLLEEEPPLALLHLILWLIHAVVRALASAIVDVFTSLTGILIALGVVVAVAVTMAGVFGLGGFGLWQRRRRNRSEG